MECPETLEAKQTISLVALKSLPRLIRWGRHFWQINKALVTFRNLVSGLIYFRSVVDLYNIARITQLSKAFKLCIATEIKIKWNQMWMPVI